MSHCLCYLPTSPTLRSAASTPDGYIRLPTRPTRTSSSDHCHAHLAVLRRHVVIAPLQKHVTVAWGLVMCYHQGPSCVQVACTPQMQSWIIHIWYKRQTDRQTDRLTQTNRQCIQRGRFACVAEGLHHTHLCPCGKDPWQALLSACRELADGYFHLGPHQRGG